MVMPELARGLYFLQEIALGRARGVRTRTWNSIDRDTIKNSRGTCYYYFFLYVCLERHVTLKELKIILDRIFTTIANLLCLM